MTFSFKKRSSNNKLSEKVRFFEENSIFLNN